MIDEKEYRRKYYLQHKEKIDKQNREWAISHREECKKISLKYYYRNKDKAKEYQLKNKEKISRRTREWYLRKTEGKVKKRNQMSGTSYTREYKLQHYSHLHRIKFYQLHRQEAIDYSRQYYLTHKDKVNEYMKARTHTLKERILKGIRSNGLTIKIIQLVYEDNIKKYGTLTCEYDKKTIQFGKDVLEHKTPLSRGGTNDYENLCIACRSCNSSKGTKTVKEFMEYKDLVKKLKKGGKGR